MKTQFIINEENSVHQKGLVFLKEGDNFMHNEILYRVDTTVYIFEKKLLVVYVKTI